MEEEDELFMNDDQINSPNASEIISNHQSESESVKPTEEESPRKKELGQIQDDVNKLIQETFSINQTIAKRNQERLQILKEFTNVLTQEQYNRFAESLNKNYQIQQQLYDDLQSIPPIEIDENNPLDSLKMARARLAKDVCDIMKE